MKIGIISDSHDNIDNLNKALEFFVKEKVKEIIHCGDLCGPFIIRELSKLDGVKIHVIEGNTCDEYTTLKFASETGVNFYGPHAEIEIDKKKVMIVHYPIIAEGLALSGKYAAVFYGHSHLFKVEKKNKTWLVNPGSVYGNKEKPSCIIWDTAKDEIKQQILD
ncbi:MAG: YfcE family phosphodiesterase [Nanoarchaeota archaeon]